METFVKGDIIVISFPYTDLSKSTPRPAFVIKQRDPNNLIICPITSSENREKYSYEISSDSLMSGDLRKDKSFIKYDMITTLHKSKLKYNHSIGRLKNDVTAEVIKKIVDYLLN